MSWLYSYGEEAREGAAQAEQQAREQQALEYHHQARDEPGIGAEVVGCRLVEVVHGRRVLVCRRCAGRFELSPADLVKVARAGRLICDCIMQIEGPR